MLTLIVSAHRRGCWRHSGGQTVTLGEERCDLACGLIGKGFLGSSLDQRCGKIPAIEYYDTVCRVDVDVVNCPLDEAVNDARMSEALAQNAVLAQGSTPSAAVTVNRSAA